MQAMWLVAAGVWVEFAELWLQSVPAPIGRFNMKEAFCLVLAVFSTARVNTTAGKAEACSAAASHNFQSAALRCGPELSTVQYAAMHSLLLSIITV